MRIRVGQMRSSGPPEHSTVRIIGRSSLDSVHVFWIAEDEQGRTSPLQSSVIEQEYPLVAYDPEIIAFMLAHPAVRRELLDAWGYVPGCYPQKGYGPGDPDGSGHWIAFREGMVDPRVTAGQS